MTASQLIRSAAFALGALAFCAGPAYAEGDAAAGKKVFRKCAACHTVQAGKNRVGPSLADIVDRPAATAEGFKSSADMQEFGAGDADWEAANLDAYIAHPTGFIQGNKKGFPGLKKDEERADVNDNRKKNGKA